MTVLTEKNQTMTVCFKYITGPTAYTPPDTKVHIKNIHINSSPIVTMKKEKITQYINK